MRLGERLGFLSNRDKRDPFHSAQDISNEQKFSGRIWAFFTVERVH